MHIHVFLLHDYFMLLILIFPLLDMWAGYMRCVELGAMWVHATGATSRIPHLLFPVSRYLVICYQQSLGPVIMLHVDTLLYWILLHGNSVYYYFLFMSHWYTDTPIHRILSFHILLSSLHGSSVHSYIMFTHHCYTCMYCFYILVIWITVHIACLIVACIFLYSCCMIVSRYWYSHYWIRELLICDVWNPTPISRYLVSCYQQSSCHVIVLHVPCTILIPDTLYTLNVLHITWGWGRLDGWLDLIRWMSESIVSPTAGDMVALTTFPFPVSRYLFNPIGLALVSAARESL